MVSPKLHVVLIGPGGVGSTVLDLVNQLNHPMLKLDMVLDSTHVCSNADLIQTWLVNNLKNQALKTSPVSFKTMGTPYTHLQDLFIQNNEKASFSFNPKIMVDCTASNDLPLQYYLPWLEQGYYIVTANKKGLVSDDLQFSSFLFKKYASNSLLYESTVGAGLPVISTLLDLIATKDTLHRIEGVMSGSLSFLFNQFTTFSTSSFSDLILQAKHLGFTEPDPREDLNGMDVARKLIILARTAGWTSLTLSQVSIQSLIPPSLQQVNLSTFLHHLNEIDTFIAPYIKNSKVNQTVPRYVGVLDFTTKEAFVGIKEYPKDHSFTHLSKSDNCIQFITERFPNGLLIQGAGAGNQVTAFGILSDILKICRRYA